MSNPQPHGRSAQIDDLAARLLVAAYSIPAFTNPDIYDERGPAQWAKDVVPAVFIIAEAFFAEADRRHA